MSSALFYGCLGAGLAMFSNAARKLPLMRQPWEHVMYFGVGAYLGGQIEGFKSAKRQELNEIMEEREKLAREKEARVAARNAALQVQESA